MEQVVTLLVVDQIYGLITLMIAILSTNGCVAIISRPGKALKFQFLVVFQLEKDSGDVERLILHLLRNTMVPEVGEPRASEGLCDGLANAEEVLRGRVRRI